MNDLIFCTGFKGGIGKSFMTAAVVDYLSSKNDNIVVVDTDSTIPDVFKTRFQVQSATPSPWVLASSKKTS